MVSEKAAFLQSLCKSTGKVVTKGKDTTQKEARKNCILEATGSIGHNLSNCVHLPRKHQHTHSAEPESVCARDIKGSFFFTRCLDPSILWWQPYEH